MLLAFANGANDNFKGVATLFGSGTSSYRRALGWATVTTALGSLTALLLARGLLAAFSGKGLVPTEVVSDPAFPASVALAAGLAVLVSTRLGLPVSTTHALIGGLVGAGLVVSPAGVSGSALASGFLLPLLTSPILAVLVSAASYVPARRAREMLGITHETCVCIGEELAVVPADHAGLAETSALFPQLSIADEATCRTRYRGRVLGLSAARVLDAGHYLSSGAVGYARGLNDTPKIAALLLVGGALSPTLAVVGVALVMAIGGLLGARRVAETMSHRVTRMNPGQGLVANVVTSALVIGASRFGMPVSTTHVSCGSLFGIGAVTGGAHEGVIGRILMAWLLTLPFAAALGAGFAWALRAPG